MLKERVESALNKQLNEEIAASQRYLAASAYCQSIQLPGFAAWFLGRVESCKGAAMHYMQYINERGGSARVDGQETPEQEYSSIINAVEAALKLEEEKVKQAEELHELAHSEGDRPTVLVLEKFVIGGAPARLKSIRTLLHHLRMTEGNNTGLIMIDRSLIA